MFHFAVLIIKGKWTLHKKYSAGLLGKPVRMKLRLYYFHIEFKEASEEMSSAKSIYFRNQEV
jgi:hypothetical protein